MEEVGDAKQEDCPIVTDENKMSVCETGGDGACAPDPTGKPPVAREFIHDDELVTPNKKESTAPTKLDYADASVWAMGWQSKKLPEYRFQMRKKGANQDHC
ncbi:hypothetical protein BSKO_03125 [Bryopsis sp. KO-2023]|nr:hypothetical protein BSKO_03125 [Bryopsis sp. KO-2023]